MAITALEVSWAGWVITVVGWLLSPIITLLLPKILSFLGLDASQKLQELEIHIIPELQQTLRAVDQERMLERKKKVTSDLAALDKMAAMLRHAREDADDIFDDAQHKIVAGDIFYGAVSTCIARCSRSCAWIARILQSGSARLAPARRSEVNIAAATSGEPVSVAIDIAASDKQALPAVSTSTAANSSFNIFMNICRSILYWSVHAFEAVSCYRNWSYEVVGITSDQENATMFDFFLNAIPRWNLKKRIEKIESTVGKMKKSPLLGVASKSAPNDIANKNRSRIRIASNHKVVGREALRDSIMAKLRDIPHDDAPSTSTRPCYLVIGIYGVAGSGKTTFARYIRDYIEEECMEEKLFDTIICIHVSETFSLDVIFHEMLKDITDDRHSNISDREELEEKLKKSLKGKRFFLILDDLWVKSKSDRQLLELISPLYVGKKGSKILVTARTKDAARALCVDEPIKMPDLDEDQYLSMFMHYALGGTDVADEEHISVGREIAKKLHRSPIAAAIVAGQLGTNPNISYWNNTARLDMSNGTMDVLWWSYQQLSTDIRRCFEYCTMFPRRFKLERSKLVHLWIAQGFVKAGCAKEDMEDVAEGYIQELVSCSFLLPVATSSDSYWFRIHDLLHDLVEMVIGTDCSKIQNESSQRGEGGKGDNLGDVRHLFIPNYDAKLINDEILGLKNLRTLIINVVGKDTRVEEKTIESICKRLLKLRVFAVAFSQRHLRIHKYSKFSIPESVCQLKYLRYFAFKTKFAWTVILPNTLHKLRHIQLLDFGRGKILVHTIAELINLRHIFCCPYVELPNIEKLISLQTMPRFKVRSKQGYQAKQLRNLNKLRGKLDMSSLGNVKSKEEAVEANLAAKERLTDLSLWWSYDGDTRHIPEVEAEVLEGLCPPVGLQKLKISRYKGSRYPYWMESKNNGGPKDLQELYLSINNGKIPAPQLVEAFPHLRKLSLWYCSWDALPGNMELLTMLNELKIESCMNIRSLPTLPQCLDKFTLCRCDSEFSESCKTVGHPNWHKIDHIPTKSIW